MQRDKNIVLIGLMGSGKTTIGHLLQKALDEKYMFIDTDVEIEKKVGKTIPEIFSEEGEAFFRNIETEVIRELSKQKNLIISTGGGAVIREENLKNLQNNGQLFYLKTDVEILAKRLANDKTRPLLNNEDRYTKLKELLDKREVFYNKAHFVINTNSKEPQGIVEEILSCLK